MSIGALSVTFSDAGDQPLYEPAPETHPLWNRTEVRALFDQGVDLQVIQEKLIPQLNGIQLEFWRITQLEDQEWERAWLQYFQPMQFGEQFWVCPTDRDPPDSQAVNLLLDPGLAFGTGTHATTSLCLEWLAEQELAGKTVVDYGCGSGILGIASILLGAEHCDAVDIDPQALIATRDNAGKNQVDQEVACYLPEEINENQADIVIANILAQPLIDLAELIGSFVRPGGVLVLSGILATQTDAVSEHYASHFDFSTPVLREEWARLEGIKQGRLSVSG